MAIKPLTKALSLRSSSCRTTSPETNKGANERNGFFVKNKQTLMYNEQGKGLTISGTN